MGKVIKAVPPPHQHENPPYASDFGNGSQWECSCGMIYTLFGGYWKQGDLQVPLLPVNRFTTKAPVVPIEEPKKKKTLWDVIKQRATKGTEWGGPK